MGTASNSKVLWTIPLLIVVCLVSVPAEAKYGGGTGTTASAETSTYVFLPEQSTVVQTGGIASVHWTYSVEGRFELAIGPNAGTASFTRVDANATDDSRFKRTLDPNHVFNMTSLVGTVLEDATIKFTGKASDDSEILITLAFVDDLAHLIGHTTPPPHSADFFIFELDAVAQRTYSGGMGEPNDPYRIATAEDLMLLGDSPEDYDKHFILTADIDLDPNLTGRWVFDGAVIPQFFGVFDGNGHTISHLTITGGGLFGQLGYGAEVRDLGVVDVNITGSGNYVGGLVGKNDGDVAHCSSTGPVDGNLYVGGLVGMSWINSSICNCYSSGDIVGEAAVGGLVGYNAGDVSNCYSAGPVAGVSDVGGLVGANVRHDPVWDRGAYIIASYSTGAVTGDEHVGGLVGKNDEGDVWRCFWDIQTSSRYNMCGREDAGASGCSNANGKRTALMQDPNTFLSARWDFINVWGIGENQTYPYLRKYSAADINEDGSVDFGDLGILAENWLESIEP